MVNFYAVLCVLVLPSLVLAAFTPPYRGITPENALHQREGYSTSLGQFGFNEDLERYPANTDDSKTPKMDVQPFQFLNGGGKLTTAHRVLLANPLFGHFSIQLPYPGGCGHRVKTSDTATHDGCVLATNAGFFDVVNGDCIGDIVTDGKVVLNTELNRPSFGLDNNGNFVAGYFGKETVEKEMDQLVTGVLWLVRNGTNNVNASIAREAPSKKFCTEMAPRTAVGHDKSGRLLILDVDGHESTFEGINVWHMAELMIQAGAWNAVNVDGGGSSTLFYEGKVISKCSDACPLDHEDWACPTSPKRCERSVTTITCIK